jgi:hypothetical protein
MIYFPTILLQRETIYCKAISIADSFTFRKNSLCWIVKNILHTFPVLSKELSSTEKVKRFKCIFRLSGYQISKHGQSRQIVCIDYEICILTTYCDVQIRALLILVPSFVHCSTSMHSLALAGVTNIIINYVRK